MHNYKTTRRAFRLYHSYNPHYFPLRLFQILFTNLTPFFTLWMSAEIVTALYEKKTKEELFLLVAITLCGNLFIHVMGAILGRCVDNALKQLEHNEAAAFNKKTLSLDYDKLENPEVRHLRRKIVENSWINCYGVTNMRWCLENLITYLVNILYCSVLFAEMVSLIAKLSFDIRGILLLVAIVTCVVLTVVIQSRCGKKQAAAWERSGDLLLRENRLGGGYSQSGMDSRFYKQQAIVEQVDRELSKEHKRLYSEINYIDFALRIPSYLSSKASELCSYLLIGLYCTLGAFPVGSVIKYVGYLGILTNNIGMLFYTLSSLKTNEQFLETYLEYFDIQNDMYQGSLSVEKRSDKQFDIEFKNVSFRYSGSEDFALKDINLNLKVGERLAVVGQNGSGKTTFIKLLCRLYDPTEGEIHMNDFNVRKYDYRQYLDLFSVVFQDYNLLAMPLGNNVASSETWDAVKAEQMPYEVGFGERYEEMPKKLETSLYKNFDEEGVNVSGGEAQKIALARALYKDAPFIILDEPTAALDPIAEAEIYSKFDEIVGDKTAIYISHRLSSCRFCDKIAVFDEGRIVQVGTHEELLTNTEGKYYELWNAQASYYA